MKRTAKRGLSKSRVMIVDDHPIVRHGLAELINQEPDLEVCGKAADVSEALRLIGAAAPHVVIIDIGLGGENGIELIEQIKAQHPKVKMLVSSVHDETVFAGRALRAGALGYISKREAIRNILDATRQVLSGEVYLSPQMTKRLMHQVAIGQPLTCNPVDVLSNRELEVLELIGDGLSTKQIAGKLLLSPKTVETHRQKIKTKLNIKGNTELSHYAYQWLQENR